MTWEEYGKGLEDGLKDLHGRIQRPLGIAALEDKIVQHAIGRVLNPIWEEDFLGYSYGFRPGRSQQDALDALHVGITQKKVNWVLDLDIRSFFDKVKHEWVVKFVEHRIADKRVVRLIQKWLKAGVMEDGRWFETKEGTPQGSVISPILANLYLHYVLDVWVEAWRRKVARGEMIIVRYADDAVLGFQHRDDAERFLEQLRERLRKFGLELHPDKTRLMEFGRFAAERRKGRGEGKPETFNFLGFTHMWAEPRDRLFHGIPQDDRQTPGSQAEGNSAAADTADARTDCGNQGMADFGGSRVLPISRPAGQSEATANVPGRRAPPVAAPASAAKSTEQMDLGTSPGATGARPPRACDSPPLASRAVCGQTFKVGTVCASSRQHGSVRGAGGNHCPYRDP